MKRTAAIALSMVLAGGCASRGYDDAALVEAGRIRRRAEPAPSAPELRREMASFLEQELPLMTSKTRLALERELRLWRMVTLGGAALGLLGATSGSLTSSSDGAVRTSVTTAGILAALGGWVANTVRTKDLRACLAFLDAEGRDLAEWRDAALPPAEGPVSQGVFTSWIDRSAAVRGNPACRRAR